MGDVVSASLWAGLGIKDRISQTRLLNLSQVDPPNFVEMQYYITGVSPQMFRKKKKLVWIVGLDMKRVTS